MYKVYWTEVTPDNLEVNCGVTYDGSQMLDAMKLCEDLRHRRRAGERILFVAMVAEDPNCVGEMGVSDKLPADYNWTKQDRAGKVRRR